MDISPCQWFWVWVMIMVFGWKFFSMGMKLRFASNPKNFILIVVLALVGIVAMVATSGVILGLSSMRYIC